MNAFKNNRVPKNGEDGFSLAELMVAVITMSVLMFGALFAFTGVRTNAFDSTAMSALKTEYAALEQVKIDNGKQAAEIEAFAIENIGNVGAYKKFDSIPESSFDYATFVRVSDLSGEVDVTLTYKGDTKMFDKSEDGYVTASYLKMQSQK